MVCEDNTPRFRIHIRGIYSFIKCYLHFDLNSNSIYEEFFSQHKKKERDKDKRKQRKSGQKEIKEKRNI